MIILSPKFPFSTQNHSPLFLPTFHHPTIFFQTPKISPSVVMELSGENKKRLCCTKNIDETLPHELIIEILSRLPSKHLWPLRFVSKSWFQLLTKDPQFSKLQFHRFRKSNTNPSIVATKNEDGNLLLATEFESCDKALTLQVPFYLRTNHSRLSGNCNGLLCFHRGDNKEVYIWNPVINDHITISCLPAPSTRFPSSFTFTGFGFGCDQDSNVYKVVRFFSETDLTGVSLKTWTQISVYTIGVDSMWRTVQLDFPCYLRTTHRIVPLVNGVLHCKTGFPDVIFTFDMKTEVIGELQSPCGIEFDDIVELGGLLCCVVDPSEVSEMHIWVMKEYGLVSSWSKKYIIGIPQGGFDELVPLGFTNNGEIIMDKNNKDLSLYSPETNTVRDLNGFREAVFLPYAYIGSIISPTVISRAGHNLLEEES